MGSSNLQLIDPLKMWKGLLFEKEVSVIVITYVESYVLSFE